MGDSDGDSVTIKLIGFCDIRKTESVFRAWWCCGGMEVGLETERVVAGRAAVLTICVARKRDESMTRTQLRSPKFNCLVLA